MLEEVSWTHIWVLIFITHFTIFLNHLNWNLTVDQRIALSKGIRYSASGPQRKRKENDNKGLPIKSDVWITWSHQKFGGRRSVLWITWTTNPTSGCDFSFPPAHSNPFCPCPFTAFYSLLLSIFHPLNFTLLLFWSLIETCNDVQFLLVTGDESDKTRELCKRKNWESSTF